ncbi:EpsG family protein [uncultured Fibrobacter sp.]|uniref:EpsG family protein n=1 Tax=uncultured Fibrobacter sp. TaxID=261512 RepID=UPI0026260F8C|nr:EpsG family protein [uncultured Fibrobacter sp.]
MNDLQTIVFYLLVFFISIGLCRELQPRFDLYRGSGRIFPAFIVCCVVSFPLIFVAAFRDVSVGVDTLMYAMKYNIVKTMSLSEMFADYGEDYLYSLILYVSSHLFDKPYAYFGLMQAFVIIPLLMLSVKYSNKVDVWKILAIYCFWYYNDSLNIIRQMVAVVFVFVAFDFLQEQKKWKALLLFLIGYGFHSSAMMIGIPMFIIYAAVKKNLSLTKKIIIVGLVVLVLVQGQNLFVNLIDAGALSSRYNLYADTFISGTSRMVNSWISVGFGGVFESVFRSLVLLAVIVFVNRNDRFRGFDLFALFFAIGILIYSVGLIFYKTAYFVRLSLYFDIFGMYLLGSLDQKGTLTIIDNHRIGLFSFWISIVYWFTHVYLLTQSRSIPYTFTQF